MVKIEKKYNEKRKIVNIFQNSNWKQEYAIELYNRFEILENMEIKYKLKLFLFFKYFYLFFVLLFCFLIKI